MSLSSKTSNDEDFDLLQAAISEVIEIARLNPGLNATDLALLTLNRSDKSEMTIFQAISSLGASRSCVARVSNKPTSASWNHSSYSPGLDKAPHLADSAIEGWDLIDRGSVAHGATEMERSIAKENESQHNPKALQDAPIEGDIIVSDLANKHQSNGGDHQVQAMISLVETSSTRFEIQRYAIVGTMTSMLIETMQFLQQKDSAGQDPHEIATQIYKNCTHCDGNHDASILYDGALAIALLVPFTSAIDDSSTSQSDTPTFLGHKIIEDPQMSESPQLAAMDAISNARIEYLVLDPKDGWDRLYIGSVQNNVPHGVGCTVCAKKDKSSAGDARVIYGTWDKGVMNPKGW